MLCYVMHYLLWEVDGQSHVVHSEEEEPMGTQNSNHLLWDNDIHMLCYVMLCITCYGRWTASRTWCTARRSPWAPGTRIMCYVIITFICYVMLCYALPVMAGGRPVACGAQ